MFLGELDPLRIRATFNQCARDSLSVFVAGAFRQLHDEPFLPNWHIEAIAFELEQIVEGKGNRLIITMPPRTMKSFIASICLPAWLLGRNPGEKIICASYGQDLSQDFSRNMRKLMQSSWYREVFPMTHLDPKGLALDEIRTTKGGYRFSTSTGGTLTGRGGNFIIIDDPIKAQDAHSEVERENAFKWYSTAVVSRLNNPRTGKIIVVAQRLHMDDLPGRLMQMGGWEELCLPLVSDREQTVRVAENWYGTRPAGHVLHAERFSKRDIARLRKEMSEQDFEAQYNQRPLPPGGALFKLAWLQRYEVAPALHQFQGIVQSWDTAYEIAETNDYSVCTTWGFVGKKYYLLDVLRERLPFPDLEKAVYMMREKWKANLVIVERAGSGISLYQNIYHGVDRRWINNLRPVGSKQDRASQQSSKFERGEIWVPKDAPWLRTFEDELASFPHGKFDDQVDSAVQFLAAVDTRNLLNAIEGAKCR